MSEPATSTLAGRFPALRRLRIGRRRRLRYVAQTAATDCGAACLAMTLGYLGREVTLEQVREFSGVSREGVDAGTLIETARHFGLRGRGVKVEELDDLRYLDPGSILHWRFSHFVVFERLDTRGAWVLDPSFGRRLVPRSELDRAFTGVVLTFEPTEDFEPGGTRKAGAHRFLYRLLDQKGMMVRIVISSLLIQLFALAIPVLTGVLVDRVVPRGDHRLLTVLAIGCAALVTFQFLATLLRSHLLLYLRTRLDSRLTLDFLEHLVDLPYLFFQQRTAGDLLMRLNSNSTIREILTSSALSAVLDGVMVSLYLVLLLVANLKIGLLVAALGALRVLLFLVTRRKQRDLMAQNLQTQAESQGYQVQMLHGIETLKASGAEHRAVERWSQLYVNELNVNLQSGRLDAFVNSTLDALAVGSPLVLLVVGTNLVLGGSLTLGTMLALVALAAGFLAPLSTLVQNAVQLQRLGSYLDRINDVLEAPREQDRLGGGDRLRPAPLRGQVTLEDVDFRYGPMSPPAVQGVSIDIRPGQLVALVGSSGSGKSTLAGLLAGLLIPDSGNVMYDGVRLNDLDLRWLRSQLGYVAQNPTLFGITVRGNLALTDPTLPLRRVIEVAKLAVIHEDIAAFPLGYETPLADNGASLSGGQQQRLAIARALIHRPKVLILDEATSALDAVTESKIQANLEALRSTRIVIAHRLSTVRHADQILVMDGGRIVERGTHSELLLSDGLYAQLVAAQVEDEADDDSAAAPPNPAHLSDPESIKRRQPAPAS